MIPAKFKLILLHLSQEQYKYQIIIDKDTKNFPVFAAEPYVDFIELLKHNIGLYVDTEVPIYKHKLTDITISDSVYIYYIVFLPYDSKVKETSTPTNIIDIYEHIPQNAQNIITLL